MRSNRTVNLAGRFIVLAAAVTLLGSSAVLGAHHVEKILSFDEASGENPEGVAVDKVGNLFVSIAPLGQLWKFAPGATEPELFGYVAGINPLTDFGMLGMAVDARGSVYACVQSIDPAVNGVWFFERKTAEPSRVPGTEQIPFPNDVAFDKRGNLYITDSLFGNIWRVPKRGELEPWLVDDPNLDGNGSLGLGVPIGANGIEYRRRMLYVAVSEQSTIVTIPVLPNGTPGPSSVLAILPPGELFPGFAFPAVPDGLALDVRGNVYVAVISLSSVAKVTRHGDVSTLAEGDPLDWASSLAFGTGRGARRTLLAVNFSIGEANGDPVIRSGPGVVAIRARGVGLPLP